MNQVLSGFKQSHRQRIFADLQAGILSGRIPAGRSLPTVRALARAAGTSTMPVVQALAQLEEEGLVRRHHGTGVEVLQRPRALHLRDSVALLMHTEGHVFADLHQALLAQLQVRQHPVVTLPDDGTRDLALWKIAATSEVHALIIYGSVHTLQDEMRQWPLAARYLFGVLEWESDWCPPNLRRILLDQQQAARDVVDYLWSRGHRHILVVGAALEIRTLTDTEGYSNLYGRSLVREWQARGGSYTTLTPEHDGDVVHTLQGRPTPFACFDRQALRARLAGPPAATAVVSHMDLYVRAAMIQIAADHLPMPAPADFVGYGNTPWAHYAGAPFPSVDWNIDGIVAAVIAQLDSPCDGLDEALPVEWIPPQLVLPPAPEGAGLSTARAGTA